MKKISIVLIIMLLSLSFVFANGGKEEKNVQTSDAVTIINEDETQQETTSTESTETESLTKTVAIVNLIRQAVVTENQVQATLEAYKDYGVTRDEVVNSLVEDELVRQAVERDGYKEYIQYYKDLYLEQYRAYIESQLGKEVTDEEFDEICLMYNGATADEIGQQYSENYVARSYIQVVKADMFENAVLPTEEDVATFYNKNISSFVSAENVKLAHVFFKGTENKEAALEKATNVSNLIKNGSLSFEDAVLSYSEDANSKENGGEIGFFSLDDAINTASMGENFVNQIFKLNVGEVSSVIESNVGYHIVKISEHNKSRLLGLDEMLSEEESVTVSDYILSYLTEQLYENLMSVAYQEVIEQLKTEASIRFIGD